MEISSSHLFKPRAIHLTTSRSYFPKPFSSAVARGFAFSAIDRKKKKLLHIQNESSLPHSVDSIGV
jgi:hypothetical protein